MCCCVKTTLTSKVQYKNFEVGEFVDEKNRSYEETIELIEKFPWDEQRQKIFIALTNPSITIEGRHDDFLKLAVFYNGKFVLHYLDKEQQLFTKSFFAIKDSYVYVERFFSSAFDASDFRKENTWRQHNAKHFVTQHFNYSVTPKSAIHFLITTSAINFLFSLFFVLFFSINLVRGLNAGIILVLIGMFFIGGGLNLILFLNYYSYTLDKVLIMSKGNDIFYYGNKNSPDTYCKADIHFFTTVRIRNSKSPVNGFALVKIEFKDRRMIKIPNLLIDYSALEEKLWMCKKIEHNAFPYIRQ